MRARSLTAITSALYAGTVLAQCPRPLTYELGGKPGPACTAGINCQAIGRGRHVSIENTPITGNPSFASQVTLDHDVVFMDTEFAARIWATDGYSVYGINTGNGTSAASILGRVQVFDPAVFSFPELERLRIRGNFVYALRYNDLTIIDVLNPANPIVRATFTATNAFFRDVEVIGSYAYISIGDFSAAAASMMVVDISNPLQPVEVRRVGNSGRDGLRISTSPSLPGRLYALTRNTVAGALEIWSISNPSNPVITTLNATLDVHTIGSDDELRATTNTICLLDRVNSSIGTPDSLRLFSTSTLAAQASPITVSDDITNIGVDPPYAYLTRPGGQVTRVQIGSPTVPVVERNYLDSPPGQTAQVANIGHGYSILTGPNDLWIFRALTGSAPQCITHFTADTGYYFYNSPIGILANDDTVVVRETGAGGTNIMAFTASSSGMFFDGLYHEPSSSVYGLEIGLDQAGNRRIYYTTGSSSGAVLHVLNASNLNSLTQLYTFGLTAGVYAPLKWLPATTFQNQPARLLVGGGSGKIQIVNVNAIPSALGIIPASGTAFATATNVLWALDYSGPVLRCYDITSPVVPVLKSTLLMPTSAAIDIAFIENFPPNSAMVSCSNGLLVRVNTHNVSAPAITQIGELSDGGLSALAFDGTAIHGASYYNGYEVIPVAFNARPAEDPNFALSRLGRQSIIPLCSGTPLTLHATFVAIPAVTSYQWFKNTANTWAPVSDGPSAGGSAIAGATTATLTISNPTGSDAGAYQCRATNSCGTGISSGVVARRGGYANCDNSTVAPSINANDFQCFLNSFAQGNYIYANCDGSNTSPLLNANDFQCFLNEFAAACP